MVQRGTPSSSESDSSELEVNTLLTRRSEANYHDFIIAGEAGKGKYLQRWLFCFKLFFNYLNIDRMNPIQGERMEEQSYILTMLVENKPSVTSRITGLFSGRGYNMESICGAPTHDPKISRITIKTKATPDQFIEIQGQLNRLIDVIKLRDMTLDEKAVKREMALISVGITPENRTELLQLTEIFNAKVVNASADSYIVEVTGTEDKVSSLVELLRPLGIKKVTRSGILALYKELEDSHKTDDPAL